MNRTSFAFLRPRNTPLYVGGVHWRCVTKRSLSSVPPYFSSHAPLYVGGVHWRCVTKRSLSSVPPYFSSHVPLYVGGVHWRCVTKRSLSSVPPYFSSHAPYGDCKLRSKLLEASGVGECQTHQVRTGTSSQYTASTGVFIKTRDVIDSGRSRANG